MQIDFKEILKKITEHKSYPYIKGSVRGGLIYLVFAFTVTVTQSAFFIWFETNTKDFLILPNLWRAVLQTVLSYLLLNTVLLSFAIYHRSERLAFHAVRKKKDFDPEAERRALFLSGGFLTELFTLVLLFLLFPLEAALGYPVALLMQIPGLGSLHRALQGLIMLLLWVGGVVFLSIHARTDARKLWGERAGGYWKSKLWKSAYVKEKQNYSYARLVLRLVGYLALYIVGSFAFSHVLPIFISFFRLILTLSVESWFWWFFGILAALILFLALRKRIQFIRNLKSTCKKYGFHLFGTKMLYFSLLYDGKSYTFGIEANGKTYYCRILASLWRSNRMILDDKGFCTRMFALHTPAPRMARGGPFVQMTDRGNGDDRIFFHIDSKVRYHFEIEGQGEKILLLNPVPRRAIREIGGDCTEADNGDRIGEYQIFAANAFLRHLVRETVSFDEKHT